ncbi:MAG: hypothetical protein R3A52_29375 [Polyangiales bacterium]
MRDRTRALGAATLVSLSLVASSGGAIPPGASRRGFVEGANHHRGDAGFVAEVGRAPTAGVDEHARLRAHLRDVRAWLASRPPTRPELATRRAELLGYLDAYIARDATPWNTHLPWRNPVFVDDYGNVCAVGYLMERSAGRAMVERVAAAHRYDYLEDITAPEVRAWVQSSGFTLEELASIQPGYVAPVVEQWQRWDLAGRHPPDGAWSFESEGLRTTGQWSHGMPEGQWTRTDAAGHTLGAGTFHAGDAEWRSQYPTGETLATGRIAGGHAEGAWRFFHRSGRLAAEGRFHLGQRDGAWRFLHDDDAGTPVATGSFRAGSITGRWRHFDARGRLLATSWFAAAPAGVREGFLGNAVRFTRGDDGVDHEVHQANVEGDPRRLDRVARGGVVVYVRSAPDETLYDARGNALAWRGEVLERRACRWSASLRAAARRGDLARMNNLLDATMAERCDGAPTTVSAAERERVRALLASLRAPRAATPEFVRALAGEPPPEGEVASSLGHRVDEMTEVLADHMTWYVEWPHVDGRFTQVYATLPGRYPPDTISQEGSPLDALPQPWR